MMKLLFYGFLIYALYRFVFNVVVPVSKASSQIKSTLKEMQAQQAAAARAQQEQTAQAAVHRLSRLQPSRAPGSLRASGS